MSWILTKGMQNLRSQVDVAFPNRDEASDGTVGDLAHQTGSSGHNPDLTGKAEYKDGDSLDEVRAWDMDTDLRAAPATAQQVVDHIRQLPNVSSVLRYIIFNRKIYRASNGWVAEAYDGPSPHTEHIHFSGAWTQAADNNTSFNYRLEAIPVALTAADKAWISKLVTGSDDEDPAAPFAMKSQSDGTPTSTAGNAVWAQGLPDGTKVGAPRGVAWSVLKNLGVVAVDLRDEVVELRAEVAELKAEMAKPKPTA